MSRGRRAVRPAPQQTWAAGRCRSSAVARFALASKGPLDPQPTSRWRSHIPRHAKPFGLRAHRPPRWRVPRLDQSTTSLTTCLRLSRPERQLPRWHTACSASPRRKWHAIPASRRSAVSPARAKGRAAVFRLSTLFRPGCLGSSALDQVFNRFGGDVRGEQKETDRHPFLGSSLGVCRGCPGAGETP